MNAKEGMHGRAFDGRIIEGRSRAKASTNKHSRTNDDIDVLCNSTKRYRYYKYIMTLLVIHSHSLLLRFFVFFSAIPS